MRRTSGGGRRYEAIDRHTSWKSKAKSEKSKTFDDHPATCFASLQWFDHSRYSPDTE